MTTTNDVTTIRTLSDRAQRLRNRFLLLERLFKAEQTIIGSGEPPSARFIGSEDDQILYALEELCEDSRIEATDFHEAVHAFEEAVARKDRETEVMTSHNLPARVTGKDGKSYPARIHGTEPRAKDDNQPAHVVNHGGETSARGRKTKPRRRSKKGGDQ